MNKIAEMNRKGFTLIEVIVVAAIIAILAGILVPMIFSQIDESKKTKALGDCKSIQNAFTAFQGTAKKLPVYYTNTDCTLIASFAYSDGNGPTTTDWPQGTSDQSLAYLLNIPANHACYNNKDAINVMPVIPADPWGRQYISNTADFATPGAPVWIISAGPDGLMQTLPTDTVIPNTSDDIGLRLQ